MCSGSNGGTDEEAGSRTVNMRLRHTERRMRRRRQQRLIRKLFIFPRLFVGRKPLRRSDFCPNDPIGEPRERQVSPFGAERNFSPLFVLPLFADIKCRHTDQTHASVSLLHLRAAKNNLNRVWQPT